MIKISENQIVKEKCMLAHETNFDDHLDALEDMNGHIFSMSRKHMKRKGLLAFEKDVVKEILDGEYDHTVILIEEPATRYKGLVGTILERIGQKVDGVKKHMIHIFYIPPDMFKPLDAELRNL